MVEPLPDLTSTMVYTPTGFLVKRDVAKKYCYANSVEDFIKIMQKRYYAHGYYYHGKRDCKYIVNKNED